MAKINWTEGLDLEQRVAYLIREMEIHGVLFDLDKANYQVDKLQRILDRLYLKIRPYLTYYINTMEAKWTIEDKSFKVPNHPDYLLKKGDYNFVKKIHNKNGEYSKAALSFDKPEQLAGPYSRIEIVEPTLSKRLKLIDQLLVMGWHPTQFTEKGRPQLTIKGIPVKSLRKLGPFGESLSDWYVCSHRQGQIKGFIDKLRPDGRLTPGCNPCGTNTLRAKHHTIANLPRAKSFWGKPMRSLMTVPAGYSMVGGDLSGLELRCLANRMRDPMYIELVLSGDVHIYNMEKVGLESKDQAKTFIYAFLYGAGNAKIGEIIGGTSKDGADMKAAFLASLPSLSKLIDKVQHFAEVNGWLPTLDNRKVYLRRYEGRIMLHTALNLILQCDGAVIAKRSLLLMYDEVQRRKLLAQLLIYYHDEFQWQVKNGLEEEMSSIMINSMQLSGRFYKMRLEITGEVKIGTNWRHTH